MCAPCGCQGSGFTGEDAACLSLPVMDEVVMVGKWLAPDGKCKECGRETVSPLLNTVMSPSQAMMSQDWEGPPVQRRPSLLPCVLQRRRSVALNSRAWTIKCDWQGLNAGMWLSWHDKVGACSETNSTVLVYSCKDLIAEHDFYLKGLILHFYQMWKGNYRMHCSTTVLAQISAFFLNTFNISVCARCLNTGEEEPLAYAEELKMGIL